MRGDELLVEFLALPVLYWFLHVFIPLGIIYLFISFPVSFIRNSLLPATLFDFQVTLAMSSVRG